MFALTDGLLGDFMMALMSSLERPLVEKTAVENGCKYINESNYISTVLCNANEDGTNQPSFDINLVSSQQMKQTF